MKQQWNLATLLDNPKKRTRLLAAMLVIAPVGIITWLLAMTSDANQRSQASAATDTATSQTSLETPATPLSPEPQATEGDIHETQTSLRVETVQPDASQAPQTSVEVNGQPVDVPSDGTVHKVIQDVNGTTTLDVSSSSSSSSGGSRSSTNVDVNMSSRSTTRGD